MYDSRYLFVMGGDTVAVKALTEPVWGDGKVPLSISK